MKFSIGKITQESLYVIQREPKGNLKTQFFLITKDDSLISKLKNLSTSFQLWEKEVIQSVLYLAAESDREHIEKCTLKEVTQRFSICVRSVYKAMRLDISPEFFVLSKHGSWEYEEDISVLCFYSDFILNFAASEKDVYVLTDALEKNHKIQDRDDLLRHFNEAVRLIKILKPVLEEYLERFKEYISAVQSILPGIFDRTDFCRSLQGSFGEAELDYDITPGNQAIVREIEEYYLAYLLQRCYQQLEATPGLIAYSHRRRGWKNFEIILREECDLLMEVKTNFGYGEASYFISSLCYQGITAISSTWVIFYSGEERFQYLSGTFAYDVSESSYFYAFNKAIDLSDDFEVLGEVGFVDKYFRKPLEELSKLLNVVANSDTFITVGSLDQIEKLTSRSEIELIPDGDLSSLDYSFSQEDDLSLNAEIPFLLKEIGEDNSETFERAIEAIKTTFASRYSTSEVGGSKNRVSVIQLLIKEGLFRNRLFSDLLTRGILPEKAKEISEQAFPIQQAQYAKTYYGYELAKMRSCKAAGVFSIMQRLEAIAGLTEFESVLLSIRSSLNEIKRQDEIFIQKSIDPELNPLLIERDKLNTQYDELKATIEEKANRKMSPQWEEERLKTIEEEIKSIYESIRELEEQKRFLEDYICKANQIA